MRTQTFGVEVEMTGITRKGAAQVAANFFGSTAEYIGGGYDKYGAKDSSGRVWAFGSDASIRIERKNGKPAEAVELVTPILRYEDIEMLQELIRRLRKAGALTNSSCGIHVHVGADQHTPRSLRNLVNIFTSKQDIIYKALAVDPNRARFCKKLESGLSQTINKQRPDNLNGVADIWYAGIRAAVMLITIRAAIMRSICTPYSQKEQSSSDALTPHFMRERLRAMFSSA